MADLGITGTGYPLPVPVRAGEAWRNSRGSARILRYVSLLYTAFFFIEPYFRRSLQHWLWFAAFYACFISLYFAIAATKDLLQQWLIGAMFLLAFVYFPFNSSASGAFVFPVVLLAFVVQRASVYMAVLVAACAGIMLETWLFHIPVWAGLMGVFFCIVIGLSNLAYSRQQRASYMLQRANEEIEHLAQVAERERIARDLHDLLGHTLTVITIKSELANRLMDRDPERARQEMQEVESTARKALQEVREAVTGYRTDGLTAEVVRARRALESAGLAVTSHAAPTDTPPPISNALCLCLREAVTNILRHAHATRCDIRLSVEQGSALLTVTDNGVGIRAKHGNGLRGMRERLRAVDGTLDVQSEFDQGTVLRVSIPLGRACVPLTSQMEEVRA